MGKKKRIEESAVDKRGNRNAKVTRRIEGSRKMWLPLFLSDCEWGDSCHSLLRLFMQSDAFGPDAEVQAKKKILKLTKKLQQPGVPPEKKARLLNKLEGSLAKLDSLPGLQTNGHPAGEASGVDPLLPL